MESKSQLKSGSINISPLCLSIMILCMSINFTYSTPIRNINRQYIKMEDELNNEERFEKQHASPVSDCCGHDLCHASRNGVLAVASVTIDANMPIQVTAINRDKWRTDGTSTVRQKYTRQSRKRHSSRGGRRETKTSSTEGVKNEYSSTGTVVEDESDYFLSMSTDNSVHTVDKVNDYSQTDSHDDFLLDYIKTIGTTQNWRDRDESASGSYMMMVDEHGKLRKTIISDRSKKPKKSPSKKPVQHRFNNLSTEERANTKF